MGAMLQFSPLFKVWNARTHVAGLKPGIAPTLAAAGPDVAGRTFVTMTGMCLIDRLFQDLPTFFHGAGTKIIAWDWEGGAEVHLAIGSNGKTGLSTRAFNERLLSR